MCGTPQLGSLLIMCGTLQLMTRQGVNNHIGGSSPHVLHKLY